MRRAEPPAGPVPIETGTVEVIRSADAPNAVTVLVNGMESSFLDLADPAWLEFEYMQQIMAVTDAALAPGPLRVMHLGAAACALARAIDARRPGSRQLAVEVDGALAAYARAWFALPPAPRLTLRVADARDAVAGARPGSWDVVVRDAFVGDSVPGHVCTAEFTALVARALRPGGLYLANATDHPPLLRTRRELATLATTFRHTALVTEPAILKGRRYGNVVLVGTDAALPAARLGRVLRTLPVPVTLLTEHDVTRFRGTATPVVDDPPGPPSSST